MCRPTLWLHPLPTASGRHEMTEAEAPPGVGSALLLHLLHPESRGLATCVHDSVAVVFCAGGGALVWSEGWRRHAVLVSVLLTACVGVS